MILEREQQILARLRPDYEARGFQFLAKPTQQDVPLFLQGFVPDAIASRGTEGVIIEINVASTPRQEPRLSRLASLVAKQPGWDLVVVDARERPADAVRIAAPSLEQIGRFMECIARLRAAGDDQLAFLSAWIALEALARYIDHREGGRQENILSPVQVVQRIAEGGYLDDAVAARLRGLATYRSRFAHGGLDVVIDPTDMDFIIGQIALLYGAFAADDDGQG